MVVYADVVFLLNTYVDFLLLWLTSGIRKQRTSMRRLLIAALLGGLYSTLYLWSQFSIIYLFPLKIIMSLIMIYIAFPSRHLYAFSRNLGVFYLVCFISGGALIAGHYFITGEASIGAMLFASGLGDPVSWMLILIGFPLVWSYTRFSFRSLADRQEINQYLMKCRIVIGGEVIICTGLLDTGNQLRDPVSRAPVLIIELRQIFSMIPKEVVNLIQLKQWETGLIDLPNHWATRMRLIPYRVTGNDHNLLVAFKADYVEIEHDGGWSRINKILIGIDVGNLSTDGSYQAIIHPACLSNVS